jgi:hypothetical protein
MPPKQMKGESSTFSRVTSWMLPKPKPEGAEQQSAEHEKTGDQTPSPTEVVDSSQKTPSPTEVVDSPKTNPKAWFEYLVAYENADDDDYDDGMATDEAAAIAEAMAEAAALNTTLHCHIGAKRQHEDDAQPEVPQQVR